MSQAKRGHSISESVNEEDLERLIHEFPNETQKFVKALHSPTVAPYGLCFQSSVSV